MSQNSQVNQSNSMSMNELSQHNQSNGQLIKDNIEIDAEDLEAIAIIYDQIRQIRRSNPKMSSNNDKKLASDFD